MDNNYIRTTEVRTPSDEADPKVLPRLVDAPNFEAAMRAMARNMLQAGEADPALAAIFKDAGRYVVALCAAALHDEGVTLNRLRTLAAGFGLVSSGRVYALLQYMRYLGFVALWSERDGRGQVRYVVAEAFLVSWRSHLGAALHAAGHIDPVAVNAAQRLGDPAFLARLCAAQMETLRADAGEADRSSPLFQVFLNRHAGSQILWSLLTGDGDSCPPATAFPIAANDLAARFNVSRMHVSRLLRDARTTGILIQDDEDRYRFAASANADIRDFYAHQLELVVKAARRACRDPEA